jgi:phospholipase/carboxylesterase
MSSPSLTDGSLHLTLPPDTAGQAIGRGWAELHPLARTGRLPETLVMIYGPRDNVELEMIWQLVLSSYAFARGAGSSGNGS